MQYNFSKFLARGKEIEEWLKREMGSIRTGRATPVLLDAVYVEAYGSKMQLRELAAINIEGPASLRIVPWDLSQVKAIEKAITTSNLGISASVDDQGLRVSFPQLTSERRASLIKLAKEKLEEARINVRTEREEVWDDIQSQEKDGKMGEDEKFRSKEELQKNVDKINASLEEIFERKEKEISE